MSNGNHENNEEEHIIDEIIEIDLPATFGDIVEVEGYGQRVFKVFAYRIENCYSKDSAWTDVVYELIDAVNGEWLEADAEDIELLADEADEETYMQTVDIANYPASFMQTLGLDLGAPDGDGWSANINEGGGNMAGKKEDRKLTPRELSAKMADEKKKARKEKYEKTDDLLELLAWVTKTFERTGERRYSEWADTIKADLANMHPKDK